jgi:uncharacterized membrane protein (DUF485 family)
MESSHREATGEAPGGFAVFSEEDWAEIERSPEFQRLAADRRRFVVPALAVFALWFGGFIVLAAWAQDFMNSKIVSGFTVAYAAALSLIVMTWLIAWAYMRVSNSRLDGQAEHVTELARERERGSTAGPAR